MWHHQNLLMCHQGMVAVLAPSGSSKTLQLMQVLVIIEAALVVLRMTIWATAYDY
jgi:hypothetical protein